MEEIDPQQALRSAGAKPDPAGADATLPMVVPRFVGMLLYRFDMKSPGH